MICSLTKKQVITLFGLIFFAMIVAGVGSALYFRQDSSTTSSHRGHRHGTGAAVTNGPECAVVARDIIYKGGSVVDAGIAAAICEGTSMAQSMGLGGGFFATIYIKSERKIYTLNARETAPMGSTEDMYHSNPTASQIGGLAAGIPGEIRGYQELHRKFGVLPWKELFQPTIKLCRNGLLVNAYLDNMFRKNRDFLKNAEGFSDFIDENTGEPYVKGQRVKRMKLAETMEIIASEPDALHAGSLTAGFVKDVQDLGGIITEEDMNSYKADWVEPLQIPLGRNITLHTFPPPGSGVVLGHILSLLRDNLELDTVDKVVNWQHILESMKFSYGMRTHLGDPVFEPSVVKIAEKMMSPEFIAATREKMRDDYTSQDPNYYGANTSNVEDHGTAHINILAPNGDGFTFTGTINLIFGAKVMSPTTGIILNDEMDDFATQKVNSFGIPVSPANLIKPGKRPLSSMCPSIILDGEGNIRMLVGGAGGSKITSATALVTLRHLYFNQTLFDSISSARMHHQLYPMHATYDPDFTQDLVDGLHDIGHVMHLESPDGFGAITSISNNSWTVEAVSDTRRSGSSVMI